MKGGDRESDKRVGSGVGTVDVKNPWHSLGNKGGREGNYSSVRCEDDESVMEREGKMKDNCI